jgi:hypothetical protein
MLLEYRSIQVLDAELKRIFGNRKYSNISGRVFVIYKHILIFQKSIRILIRIFNIREYSNTRIKKNGKKSNLFDKNQIFCYKTDCLVKNLILWEKIRFFRFFPKKNVGKNRIFDNTIDSFLPHRKNSKKFQKIHKSSWNSFKFLKFPEYSLKKSEILRKYIEIPEIRKIPFFQNSWIFFFQNSGKIHVIPKMKIPNKFLAACEKFLANISNSQFYHNFY